jgi:hypothetical protein
VTRSGSNLPFTLSPSTELRTGGAPQAPSRRAPRASIGVSTSRSCAPLRSTRTGLVTATLFAVVAAAPLLAWAQDSFTGVWRIEKSEPAPWATTPDMLDAKEIKRLTGAIVEFKTNAITGPAPIACRGPHYEIKQYQADMLFQGALAEYGDPATTPDKLADKIGFGKRPVASLVTGCASELEFHAIDGDHAMFALNNSLFRMTRATDAAATKSKP